MSHLRLLFVCEDPPVSGQPTSAGHTLISEALLPRLSADMDVTLVYFGENDIPLDSFPPGLTSVHRIPLVDPPPYKVWQPRSVALRNSAQARAAIAALSQAADVTYLHGFPTFGLASCVRSALVVNEIDPLSFYWYDLAAAAPPARAALMRARGARISRVERATAKHAAHYVVVNDDDARQLSGSLGRPVVAVPNGVQPARDGSVDPSPEPTIVFVGGLDYAPNIASAKLLCREVLPLVRREVPEARVVLAGRRATDPVRALVGPSVQLVENPPDVMSLFARSAVAAFPGGWGRGTRNSVLEALRAGTPTVASSASARGVVRGRHLRIAEEPAEFAAGVVDLLRDGATARAEARRVGASLPGWDDVSATYVTILRSVSGCGPAESLNRAEEFRAAG